MSGYASRSRTFNAKIEEGKLKLAEREEALAFFQTLEGREVMVVVTPVEESKKQTK